MDITYEKLFSESHKELYNKIRHLITDIPDQRFFTSEIWFNNLDAWTTEKIWQTLLDEMQILSECEKRSDDDDNGIYELLLYNKHYKPHKFNIRKHRDQLTHFMATYPTLSYTLIILNWHYELAIIGNHIIIIKEINNLTTNPQLKKKYRRYNMPYSSLSSELISYSTNKLTIELLLKNININDDYQVIVLDAVSNDNSIAVKSLWPMLTDYQRITILEYVTKLDMVELLTTTKHLYWHMVENIFYTSITYESIKILTFLLDNNELNMLYTHDDKERLGTINLRYAAIQIRLFACSNISAIIKILSKKMQIYRVDQIYGQHDLLESVIKYKDWEGLKFLIKLKVDLQTKLESSEKSPLLTILNTEAPREIHRLIMEQYHIDKLQLFCSCAKYQLINAIKYLLDEYSFTNKELFTVLQYSSGVINRYIMTKLGIEYGYVEITDIYLLKQ